MRLIATISPLVRLTALCTLPYVPSPSGLMVLYRFICAREGSKGFIRCERRDAVSGDDVMVNGCAAAKANK